MEGETWLCSVTTPAARIAVMFIRPVDEMSGDEEMTEDLKAIDQMVLICHMNISRIGATEIVREELIFT